MYLSCLLAPCTPKSQAFVKENSDLPARKVVGSLVQPGVDCGQGKVIIWKQSTVAQIIPQVSPSQIIMSIFSIHSFNKYLLTPYARIQGYHSQVPILFSFNLGETETHELIELVVIRVMSPADTGGGGKDGWSRENSTCESSEVGGLVTRGHQETRSGGRGPASTYCEDLTALIEWDEKPMEGFGPKNRSQPTFS